MGDLNKSKGMLAEMGIDVDELREMSQTIMNASSTSISAQKQKSPQRSSTAVGGGARNTRGGVGRTAPHRTAQHIHAHAHAHARARARGTPTLPLTMADGTTITELGRPETAPGRLPKVPPKSPGMDSPAAPPRT